MKKQNNHPDLTKRQYEALEFVVAAYQRGRKVSYPCPQLSTRTANKLAALGYLDLQFGSALPTFDGLLRIHTLEEIKSRFCEEIYDLVFQMLLKRQQIDQHCELFEESESDREQEVLCGFDYTYPRLC